MTSQSLNTVVHSPPSFDYGVSEKPVLFITQNKKASGHVSADLLNRSNLSSHGHSAPDGTVE